LKKEKQEQGKEDVSGYVLQAVIDFFH